LGERMREGWGFTNRCAVGRQGNNKHRRVLTKLGTDFLVDTLLNAKPLNNPNPRTFSHKPRSAHSTPQTPRSCRR
jgi:hypothetical protein